MAHGEQPLSSTKPSWGRRLVGIEGLRGLAALSVVIGHVQVHTADGLDLGPAGRLVGLMHHGLTLFFALSGFLLYRPFAAAIFGGGPRPPTLRFFRNRALRVYPAYIVIFLLCSYLLRTTYVVATNDDSGVTGVQDTLGPITSWWKALVNLSMFQTLVPQTNKTGLGVAWSLTTEITFYLVLPALAAVALWLRRRRVSANAAVWFLPAVLLATGVIGKMIAQATFEPGTEAQEFAQLWGANWHAVLERSLLVQADLFAYGAAAAVFFVMVERRVLTGKSARLVVPISAVLLLLVAAFLVVGFPGFLGSSRWSTSPVALGCAALILITTLPSRRGLESIAGKIGETRPLYFSGLWSYSIYLWHQPVLWWLVIHGYAFGRTPLGFVGNVIITIATTAILSAATYYLVEAPALKLKKRTDHGAVTEAGPTPATVVPTPTGPEAAIPQER